MQVEIACRHGSIPQDVQDYISRKAEKLLTYFERVTAIRVTVAFENGRTDVEILVDAEHKHNFVSSDTGEQVTATFDQALHKMEQQIRKYKSRIQNRRRGGRANNAGEGEAEAEESD